MRKTLQNLRKISGIILLLLVVMSTIPFSVSASVAFIGDFRYDFNDTNYTAVIRDYSGTAENVTVPATVSYLGNNYIITEMNDTFKNNTTVKTVTVSNGIKSIDYYSFLNCTNLTSVTIPESVTKIGTGAFDGCSKLASVTIPQNIITIGDNAFNKCTNLTSITIPDRVTTIGNSAFDRCSSLSSVDIGSNVENIGNSAFYGTALTEVIIPDSVITIGNNAFDHCYSLANVDFGNGVQSIGMSAFSYTALTEVIIPDSVITIGNNAFSYCYSLANVDFGNGVQSIGMSAFSYTALTEVIIPDSVTTIDGVAFCFCNSLHTLILPNGLPNLTTVGNAVFGYTDITNIFVKDGVDAQSNIYDKLLKEEIFADKARVWKYREDGTTAGGKIKATIVSVECKDGNALVEENGVLLSSDSMGDEYEIVAIEQVECFKENLEGGESKDPKEWTVYVKHNYGNTWESNETDHWQKCTACKSDSEKAPHHYNDGYAANPDGTHSPKCECGAINESVKEAHNWIEDTDDNHKCSYCKQTASHRWNISSIKEVTDKEPGEIEYECSVCGIGEIRPIPPFEENRDMLLLTQSVTKGEEKIDCVVQDPYEVLPDGVRLDSSLSVGSALLSNTANLDNTHRIEHIEFFEINLSEPTAAPISQLNAPVRVLLQIPKGWDKSEIEVVRVNAGTDIEFEESIVTIDEIDYVAFWTDHFSPYAIIDKLILSTVEDVSDVSKTYDGTAVANPSYNYSKDGHISIKWFADFGGRKGTEISKPTEAGVYWVGISTSADSNYNSAYEVTKQFTIAKATPTVDTEPTTSRVIIGGTLSDSTLLGGVASVDGKFEWKDGTEVLDSKGTVQKAVVFTPNDVENYNTVQFDVDVTVVICDTASGEHDYTEQKTNTDEHWTVCAKCGVEETDSREAHKDGTATCTAKAKCSVCGEEYGKLLDHKYEWVIDKEPTATEEGSKHEECTVCNAKQNENTAIPKAEINSPQTGDDRNMALWLALLFISGMGLVGATVYGRKKRQAR